jgi:hypothetical protein
VMGPQGAATPPPPQGSAARTEPRCGQSWPPKAEGAPAASSMPGDTEPAWGRAVGAKSAELTQPRSGMVARAVCASSVLLWALGLPVQEVYRHAGIQDFGVPVSVPGMHPPRDPPVGGRRSWRREGRLSSSRPACVLMQLGWAIGSRVVPALGAYDDDAFAIRERGDQKVVASGVAHELGEVGSHPRALPQSGRHRRAGGPKAGYAKPTAVLPPPLVPPGLL